MLETRWTQRSCALCDPRGQADTNSSVRSQPTHATRSTHTNSQGVLIPYMLQHGCTLLCTPHATLATHTHRPKAPCCRADMHLATHVPPP